MFWECRGRKLDLDAKTLVMGIVNVTPDSFSDGGRFSRTEIAIEHGLELIRDGADILDVGGESTRPGSDQVSLEEELWRVVPVVEGLRGVTDVPISVDTTKAEVARQTLAAGADIINDITALRGDPELGVVAAESGAGLVLMHMLGTPKTMQVEPHYQDVMAEVIAFLKERTEAAEAAGIRRGQIVLDPGIGFGKALGHNLEIFRRLRELVDEGWPVLMGPSRKGFIGALLGGAPVDQRVEGTAAAVTASILAGARIVRVHDVREMARVARVADAIAGKDGGRGNN